MSGKPRGIAFHTIVYALGSLGSRLIGFIMLPIYTRKLTPADYGDYELLAVTTSILGILLEAGVGSAVTRFYHRHDEERLKLLTVSTANLFLTAVFGAALALLLVTAPWFGRTILGRPEGAYFFRLIFVSFCLEGVATVPMTFFRTEERSRLVVSLSLLRLFVGLALNILFVVALDMQLEGVLWSGVITTGLYAVLVFVLAARRLGFGFRRDYLAQMLRFSLPLIPGTLAYLVIHSGDRYFLKYFESSAEVGRYGLAYKFGMLVTFLLGANFNAIWITRGLALYKQGETGSIARIFEQYLVLLLWFWIGLSVLSEDVLRYLVGAEFRGVHAMISLVALAYVLRSCADYFTTPLNFTYRSKRISLVILLSGLSSLALYALLIRAWGGLGAALATVATFGVMTALMFRSGQAAVRVPYRGGRIAVYVAVACVYVAVPYVVPLDPSPWRLALLGAFALTYPFVVMRRAMLDYGRGLLARRRDPAGADAATGPVEETATPRS